MNAHGTAPGLVLEAPGGRLLVMLPGPPRELQPMFVAQVVPILEKRFPHESQFVCRTLKSTGLGESLVEHRIAKALSPLVEGWLGLPAAAES